MNYNGNVLNFTKGISSASDCQDLCQKTKQCRFFTYFGAKTTCTMKTNNSKPVKVVGKISGPKYCPTSLPDKESIQLAKGGNLDNLTEQSLSVEEDETEHGLEDSLEHNFVEETEPSLQDVVNHSLEDLLEQNLDDISEHNLIEETETNHEDVMNHSLEDTEEPNMEDIL